MNTNKLKEIYTKYNLEKDDIFVLKFGGKDKPIITRSGIERIQSKLDISVNYKIENLSEDNKTCTILAHGAILQTQDNGQGGLTKTPKATAQSFGEVSPSNCTHKFPIAICEKRASARVILKLANLIGFYSEDDAEEFTRK